MTPSLVPPHHKISARTEFVDGSDTCRMVCPRCGMRWVGGTVTISPPHQDPADVGPPQCVMSVKYRV